MHLKPSKNKSWADAYEDKISLCNCFASEFNLADANLELIQQHAQLPNQQLLTDFISEKQFFKLEKIFLKSVNLPLRGIINYKPIFIINMLAERILLEEKCISMDSELYQIAGKMGKDLTGIETFEEQLVVLNKIPIKYQIRSLLKIGRNINQFRKQLKQLLVTYESANLQRIHKVSKNSMGGTRRLMLYDRNQLMANRISKKIINQSLFCAVGAGHLGGKKGILRLLKLKGFKVKPV